ncbi:MAG: TonB-dependent receptor [Bryobacteraceae bacterium]|nr:TonB-dependent receptor [Bryobacteraceae bacterium]
MLLTFANLSVAQVATGRIEGTVVDPAGAVVPQAAVTATNTRTGIVLTVKANERGQFIFASLPPSIYTLSVEAQGFRKAVMANLELNAAVTINEIIRLEVGSLTEAVTVEAEAVRVNTSDAQIGRSVTLRDIATLPQLGRGPLAIAVFAPGMSINPGDVTFTRVNGTRQGSNNVRLDGIDANDAVVPRFGLSMTSVNTDSVEEMRVITNGGKAEYGRNAGGQVEMITRSGTNQFHGNAFEFLRNTKLNANDFFNNSSGGRRPKFIQNIFGGSFGGPAIKDRTFFFGNYQGRRTAQEVIRNRTVLTPEAKQGLFRWRSPGSQTIQSFNIVGADPTGRGIDPRMREIFGLLPAPNNFDIGDGLNTAGFRFNNPAGSLEDQFTIKADHNLWSGHRVFYRHSWQRNDFIDSLNGADATFPGRPQGTQGGRRWGVSAGSDWMITPTIVNEFRLGYQSASVAFNRPDRPQGPAVVSNLFTDPINPAFAQGRNSPVWDTTNNLTHIRGKHTLKVGFQRRHVLQYGYNDAGIYPNITLPATLATVPSAIGPTGAAVISSADRQRFESLYNDVLGRVGQISQTFYSDLEKFQAAGTPRVRNLDFNDYGLFLQDDWKLLPNLTLNVGVRWDYYGSPVERDRLQGTLDRLEEINFNGRIDNLRIQRTGQWYNNDYNNLAPRIGFSWDPFKDGKLAIRGSYGIFYDRIIGATSSLVDGNTPGFAQQVLTQAGNQFTVDTRIAQNPAAPAQPAAPLTQQPVTRQTSVVVFDPNLATGYVQHFNLNIQREIMRNTVLDVGYVRTKGTKLFTWLDVNQPRIYGDTLAAMREIDAFRVNGTAPSANNPFVRMFGTPAAAVTGLGATNLAQGLAGTIAANVDQTRFSLYPNAGLNNFFIRNFPQFNQVILATNNGRSWYDSLQVSLARTAGSLKFQVNYTFSKALDNSSVDGNGFTAPIDNTNLGLNKARGDFDRPHALNYSVIWTLPIGSGKLLGGNMPGWADKIAGGWDLGVLGIWQSGSLYTVTSGRRTGPSTANTWANYSGDRSIGEIERRNGGIWHLTDEQRNAFSFPTFGELGSSGRNAFRGPKYYNFDISIVKKFGMPWGEGHSVQFRAELYNAFNNVRFGNPNTSIVNLPTFGRIDSTVGGARIMQMALRYDF